MVLAGLRYCINISIGFPKSLNRMKIVRVLSDYELNIIFLASSFSQLISKEGLENNHHAASPGIESKKMTSLLAEYML